MRSRVLGPVLLVFGASAAIGGQTSGVPPAGLYRFTMIQAAPGSAPDLVSLVQTRAAVMAAGGDELPILVRHSQGDRWDLLVIAPIGERAAYYSPERVAKRDGAANRAGVSNGAFAKQLDNLVSWREDVYVTGPPLAELRTYVKGATLAHLEMLQALAGQREALVREREMESAFNVARGRPRMLIFTREEGAAWDVITLDVWRDWRQYGELQMIPADVSDAAARTAGFANADAVGVAMRTVISTHHDTLGPIVPLAAPR